VKPRNKAWHPPCSYPNNRWTLLLPHRSDDGIFFLVCFGPSFDSISFNILGRHERRIGTSLGVTNVISAMIIEDNLATFSALS